MSALITNANVVLPSTSRPAPIAGPRTTARFSTALSSAFAAARSRSPTISGSIATTAGRYAVPAAVEMHATAATRATGPSSWVDAASASISAARTRSETTSTVRRSYVSATTPPSGPKSTYGTSRATVTTATQVPDLVAS